MGGDLRRVERLRAETDVRVERVRVDDLAGVHLPVRVPDRLELPERLDQLGAEHLRQQLAARLAVAVLPGDRAAVGDDEVGTLLDEGAVLREARPAREVEVPTRVHAAVAVVAVERALVAELRGELLQVTQVVADPLRRDGRVLPAFVGVVLAGKERGGSEARLAHLPDVLLLLGDVVQLHPAQAVLADLELAHQLVRVLVGLVLVLAAELDEQPAVAVGEPREVVYVLPQLGHVLDQRLVHPLEPERPVLEHRRHAVAGHERVLVARARAATARRAVDQVHRRLEVGDAGALGAGEGAGDVEAVVREQVVEVVARDAPRDLRVALADQLGVAVAQLDQAAVDLARRPRCPRGRAVAVRRRAAPRARATLSEVRGPGP